jgi:hypothetical protein
MRDLNSLNVSISGPAASFVGTPSSESIPANSCSVLPLTIAAQVSTGEYLGVISVSSANLLASSDLAITVE